MQFGHKNRHAVAREIRRCSIIGFTVHLMAECLCSYGENWWVFFWKVFWQFDGFWWSFHILYVVFEIGFLLVFSRLLKTIFSKRRKEKKTMLRKPRKDYEKTTKKLWNTREPLKNRFLTKEHKLSANVADLFFVCVMSLS